MLIESIYIERFKSISNLELPLSRVTTLVGSNNAGKSSVLQAIQFGVSTIQTLGQVAGPRKRSGTLAADQLVYTPLRDPAALAQGGNLVQARERKIVVGFSTELGSAQVGIRRGKNSNLAVDVDGDAQVLTELQNIRQPFSAFTPGLAGIPPVEEFRAPGVVRRAAAYGDANSVFRNVLWLLKNDLHGWKNFSDRMMRIFPDVKIDVNFDGENDAVMRAQVTRNSQPLPVDAAGTGILQAAQILSYIGVYRPKLLVLDEPDSHLHPSNQRLLIRLLGEVAEEDDFQVLLSTHSRHILDECISMGGLIHWMANGTLRTGDVGRVPVLLSLGALDVGDRLKNGIIDTVVLTEDTNTKYIDTLLSSSGRDMDKVQIWSYGGCTQLEAAKVLASFIDNIAPGCEVIVHRDRDYLSDEEIKSLREKFNKSGFTIFITEGTDIESHFLNCSHLSKVFPLREDQEISELVDRATENTKGDSLRIMANSRYSQAVKSWDRSDRHPEAGNIYQACSEEYESDPTRFRHGKKTLKEFNKLAESEWGGSRNVAMDSQALFCADLQPKSFTQKSSESLA